MAENQCSGEHALGAQQEVVIPLRVLSSQQAHIRCTSTVMSTH